MLGYYKMSIIGTAHQAKKDGVCQDASDVVVLKNGWVVAAIADGLGSAKKSEVGSTTAVKTVLSFVSEIIQINGMKRVLCLYLELLIIKH